MNLQPRHNLIDEYRIMSVGLAVDVPTVEDLVTAWEGRG